ncbi:MAG: hypothetical protein AB8B72_05410 [Crocinitomicaceae bacterium]
MKTIVFVFFLNVPFFIIAQQKEYYQNTTVFAEGDFIRAQTYNNPESNPQNDSYGIFVGISSDAFATPRFHLNLLGGYRFVQDYANFEVIDRSTLMLIESDFVYHGVTFGLGMAYGRKHLWETTGFIGTGTMYATNGLLKRREIDVGIETGYKYISPIGYTIRVGHRKNIGRNFFESTMKSIYFGFGYTFQKSKGKIADYIPPEEPNYGILTGSAYLFAFTGDIIGLNLRYDYIPINGKKIDLGFGISGQAGVHFYGNLVPSMAFYTLALIGEKSGKLEMSAGVNVPFTNNSVPMQYIHAGIGFRLVSKDNPYSFRIGTATTSVFNIGIGCKFDFKK